MEGGLVFTYKYRNIEECLKHLLLTNQLAKNWKTSLNLFPVSVDSSLFKALSLRVGWGQNRGRVVIQECTEINRWNLLNFQFVKKAVFCAKASYGRVDSTFQIASPGCRVGIAKLAKFYSLLFQKAEIKKTKINDELNIGWHNSFKL